MSSSVGWGVALGRHTHRSVNRLEEELAAMLLFSSHSACSFFLWVTVWRDYQRVPIRKSYRKTISLFPPKLKQAFTLRLEWWRTLIQTGPINWLKGGNRIDISLFKFTFFEITYCLTFFDSELKALKTSPNTWKAISNILNPALAREFLC